MINKIISGGQTGADRAALDVAIMFNIPHGGWIPKGRLAEDGPLSLDYQLQEVATGGYQACAEQNVIDSDGTLIFARGKLTGGTDYTRQMVLKHKEHLLHIDLNMAASYDAASLILSWIRIQNIKALNVAGPMASEDYKIYGEIFRILEFAYVMDKAEKIKSGKPPKTVEEAIESLIKDLSLKDRATIANMEESELNTLDYNLGKYIRHQFGLCSGNNDLMKSCCSIAGRIDVDNDEASSIIITELWKRLKDTHKLRIVS